MAGFGNVNIEPELPFDLIKARLHFDWVHLKKLKSDFRPEPRNYSYQSELTYIHSFPINASDSNFVCL